MDQQAFNTALSEYFTDWEAFTKDLRASGLAVFPEPNAVGWKVADVPAFSEIYTKLLSQSSQLHVSIVNNRLIGSFILKDPIVVKSANPDGPQYCISVVKLMQVRPGSKDALGLDHVDFYCTDVGVVTQNLNRSKVDWERQENTMHAWLSVRFGATQREAKIVDHIVLDVCARELEEASQKLKHSVVKAA